ncbi:MAG: nitroreductase family protein [Moraxellaceae bacterium]|jgi:nitroreductase|nr:nitroreductase family protein [Moraxellaceae bacterium]MDF3030347.1 nitroreductase family protein [Moraxellaceae bacterium]
MKQETKPRYQEAMPQIDAEEFRKVVMSRRSVRRFDDTPLPDAVLDDCLDMALLAPNSSNLQPWEFHVVRTPELKRKLAAACLNQNAAKTAQALVVMVARTDTWPAHCELMLENWPDADIPPIVRNYYSRVARLHYRQGPLNLLGWTKRAIAAVAGLRRPVPRGPFSHADMKVWAAKTVALAAENFMLALRAHGFDSCPMEGFDETRVRRLLKLPSDGFVVMVVGCGKRARDGVYHARIRFARDRFVKEH